MLRRDRQAHRKANEARDAERREEERSLKEPRRSLSNLGGVIDRAGDEQASEVLAAALNAAERGPADDLTHGFHSYAARMHPAIAAHLISAFSAEGDIVLDPFCGSGTVLVEALVRGRRAAGVDLDPLALRIASVHTELRDARSRSRFARTVHAIAVASEARVRTRQLVDVPIDKSEQRFYDPHVMLELSGLLEEISSVPDVADRRALAVVFSSMVVKFSRLRADTSEELVKKRIRKGLCTEFFARKGSELVARWEALFDEAPPNADVPRLFEGDARELPDLLGARFRTSLVLTSPPYGGTYDYVTHHARRHAWLGLDASALEENEVGARRNFQKLGASVRWERELLDVLTSLSQVLARSGRVVLFSGDAEVSGMRVPADQQIAQLAPRAGLRLHASASQPRPDFRGGPPRREHLLLLVPA